MKDERKSVKDTSGAKDATEDLGKKHWKRPTYSHKPVISTNSKILH
jgi:hypothetical protein